MYSPAGFCVLGFLRKQEPGWRKDEVRAWTFKKGMKAPECAGIIHTDFEKGFIKAEVMSFEDFKTYGSELKVKEAGKTHCHKF